MKNNQLTKIVAGLGADGSFAPADLVHAAEPLRERAALVLQLLSLDFMAKEAVKTRGRTSGSANITR